MILRSARKALYCSLLLRFRVRSGHPTVLYEWLLDLGSVGRFVDFSEVIRDLDTEVKSEKARLNSPSKQKENNTSNPIKSQHFI